MTYYWSCLWLSWYVWISMSKSKIRVCELIKSMSRTKGSFEKRTVETGPGENPPCTDQGVKSRSRFLEVWLKVLTSVYRHTVHSPGALNAPRVSPTCRPSVTKTIQTQTVSRWWTLFLTDSCKLRDHQTTAGPRLRQQGYLYNKKKPI